MAERAPNYVVGRGKLYFDQFLPGTKTFSGVSRYLGNSPELSMSQDEETLDHYSSDSGIRVKDATVELQNDQSMSFSLDDIAPDNLALWFRGQKQNNALVAVVGGNTLVDSVLKGSWIQLGLTAADPIGARNVSNVVVNNVTTPGVVAMANNYEIDAATGRIHILEDAVAIADGDDLDIDWDSAVGTEELVIASNEIIEGRMTFVSDNAAGEQRDYIWPYVRVRPDGDFALKGDDWQNMTFSGEVLKLNSSTERQYIVKR